MPKPRKETSKSPSREMATTEGPLVVDEKPSYLVEMEWKGAQGPQDNFDSSDIVIPRVKLLQANSEECEQFDVAKPGIFWHTGFDQPLGSEIDFVVCSRRKKFLLVAPLEDGQGILARAEDAATWDKTGTWAVRIKGLKNPVTWAIKHRDVAQSGLTEWGTRIPDDPDSSPAATLFYDYLVLLPDHLDLGPVVISLTRSQIKRAKKGLNDKIHFHASAGRPMQALVFRSRVTDEKNAEGNAYKNWQFTSNGFASVSLFDRAWALGDVLRDFRVKDEEDSAHEESRGQAEEGAF